MGGGLVVSYDQQVNGWEVLSGTIALQLHKINLPGLVMGWIDRKVDQPWDGLVMYRVSHVIVVVKRLLRHGKF